MKEGEEPFLDHAKKVRRYGAAVVVMAFDEQGQADTRRAQVRDLQARLPAAHREVGFPPEDIIFDPNIFAVATGIEEHSDYARRLHRGDAPHQGSSCPTCTSPAASPTCRSRLPRQRAGARGDALGVPLSRHPGRHGHGHRQCRPARASTTTSIPSCARLVEDVILNRRADATERLLEAGGEISRARAGQKREVDLAWRERPVEERLLARAGARHRRLHR